MERKWSRQCKWCLMRSNVDNKVKLQCPPHNWSYLNYTSEHWWDWNLFKAAWNNVISQILSLMIYGLQVLTIRTNLFGFPCTFALISSFYSSAVAWAAMPITFLKWVWYCSHSQPFAPVRNVLNQSQQGGGRFMRWLIQNSWRTIVWNCWELLQD